MPYQSQLQRTSTGDIVEVEGQRGCADRFHAIDSWVLKYINRPFTLLDLGASEGYFGCRANMRYNCVSVMLDEGPQLLNTLRGLELPNTIGLRKRIKVEELEELAKCETFDVVLALNILHHFPPDQCMRALDAIKKLGRFVIIETPPPSDYGACGLESAVQIHAELSRDAPIIHRSPSHTADVTRPMFLIVNDPELKRTRSYMYQKEHVPAKGFTVFHGDDEAVITFLNDTLDQRDWIPGINYWTFAQLNGVYPELPDRIEQTGKLRVPVERHGDIAAWNFIYDGVDFHYIDGGDEVAIYDDEKRLAAFRQWLVEEG